jgi:hypothetical protein
VTLERLERSATRLERVMLALTLVGLALAGVQIWIALYFEQRAPDHA